MKQDIIFAGVGGQGILSIAAAIGLAARGEKLYVKQSEVHGMSQRGGEVQAHLRIASTPVNADLITEGKADLIISMEPMESLRYINFLSAEGWLITNSTPYKNIDNYPDEEQVLDYIRQFPNHLLVDADQIARRFGSAKASNMVLLGAATSFLEIDEIAIEESIQTLFAAKGEKVLEINLNAYHEGLRIGKDVSLHAE